MRIKLGHGFSGRAVTNDEVVVTGDLTNDPRLAVPAITNEQWQAQVLAPMHARGKVVGILSVMSRNPYRFDENEVSVLRAIADQVGLALDNARLYESVREEQGRLQAVIQSTADAILATDRLGNINLVNQAAEALFQLDVPSVIGQPLSDAPLPPALNKKLREVLGLEGTGTGQTFEVLLENGRALAAVVSPVYATAQAAEQLTEGWVVVFQDISHMKEAERTRLQFIQTAAHDLRNPLAVTLSALLISQKHTKTPPPPKPEVTKIAPNATTRLK